MSSSAIFSRAIRAVKPHPSRHGISLSSSIQAPSHTLIPQHYYQHHQKRAKHTVRVIVTRDLPEGQKRGVYAGEVHDVSAGYARNYLIPQKMAVYATPKNFERCGMVDPALAEKAEKMKIDGNDEVEDEDLKAADLLRRYLRNKMVKIYRNVDPNMPTICHPGHVTSKNLRDKLSKQLNIDLEPHESIHISEETVIGVDDMEEKEVMALLSKLYDGDGPADTVDYDNEGAGEVGGEAEVSRGHGREDNSVEECTIKIKQLGEYIARITLSGGYTVPLRFTVEKR
mmetsp:Transcript_19825/g.41605  ORF Transcript_19825/g.41605 Transcript_19825/m.41605 type:complete len:284 (-) Transcript_19825:89-940(-)|eukprot:CAMPEP_0171328178 /NCGR_PEP_ID=MMETSP0878-20121228/495_1 /TAXON_ID=67004 /ORGANISM="Thalassiosira weissflogii, Strain CCMP1336" /LENGTH=283 /DNA_ID=CAMNT_0011828009 /DNA_START=159 /DNA_END=1010 /DNA_ORIENTATION=+